MSNATADLIPDKEVIALPALPSDEFSFLELLAAVGHRKRVVLGVTAASVVIGLLLAFLLPVKYTAAVDLLPPQQGPSLNSLLSSQLGGMASMASLAGHDLGLKNPNDMVVAMFRSRVVEQAMVQKYALQAEYHSKITSDAVKSFEAHSVVDGSSKDGLIHLSVTDRNPERAAELANGYVEQYRTLSAHLAITEAAQRRLFFEQQMEDAKNKLAGAEEALEENEQRTGVIQIDSQARALIESAASLRAQIDAREVDIRGMRSFAAQNNPDLVQAERELDGLKSELAKLNGSGSNASDDLLLPRGKIPQEGLAYIRKYRDVKYYETIFDILARQFEVAKLDEARQGSLIQVVDPAVAPDRKSSPKRTLIVMASLIIGLFLGTTCALVMCSFESALQSPETRLRLDAVRDAFRWRSGSKR